MSLAVRSATGLGLGAVLALSAGLLSAPGAQAYEIGTGSCSRWASARVTYADTTRGVDRAAFEGAAWEWTTKTDVQLVGSSSSTLRLVSRNAGPTGWAGLSSWSCGGRVGEVWPRSSATVTLNTYYTAGMTPAQRQGVATHEIGHALGLGHVPQSARSVMTPVLSVNRPQPDDVAGVNALY